MLRYGVQKTAGHPSALPDMECRKRVVAGKATSIERPGTDLACLPARAAFGVEGAVAALAVVLAPDPGAGRMDKRGARAPPLNFS
ncbi:hypothetical protein AB3G45_04155 [Shinella sp. S4-D37]|uniref:hypothetical protein n=1 Tax=Shinella sp. S4-D37 TaxID=3161999 RepID=UPI003466CA59